MSRQCPPAPEPGGLPAEWWLRVGHDLRGAIAPMRMAVQLLRSGRVGADDRDDALRLIDRQIDQLLARIDDLGDLLRLDAGRFPFRPVVQDANLLIDAVCGRGSLLKGLAERRNELRCVAAAAELMVDHDPVRVATLLEFLLLKLSEHAPEGKELVVELQQDQDGIAILLAGAGDSLASDPDFAYVVDPGQPADGEPQLRTALMREVARLHRINFDVAAPGSLRLRFPVGPDSLNSPRSGS